MTIYLKTEEWSTVKDLPETLLVSNRGRVKSHNRLLKGEVMNSGYMRVHINVDGKAKHLTVHRLVAEAFIPNPEDKPQVNHIDGDKLNNDVSNLEWCTQSENLKHSYETGLRDCRGVKNNQCKLTENDVREIRRRYGKRGSRENNSRGLASEFNVCPKTILNIVNGRLWKHIEE